MPKNRIEPESAQFSPTEFLRARRPERFSDSVVNERSNLDRSILEYHLATLTNRSQEVQFATFARHLAEREICPNLLPQTGPTGGGDSKVDSETYPVADDIALGWHTGIGREAASERWGFAFSAKKKWREKVLSDVAKALETGRGYKKVFFISNQYIRDKARGQVEDKLREKHGLDVRILDRTWILDKVFTNEHEALAIEDLQLLTSTRKEVQKGPLDTRRELDLNEIEERIQSAIQEGHLGLQVAEDCIESADLARQLERPRSEIDGLYERAEQVTAKSGTEHQRLKCAYQRAWTAFWWYEDYERLTELYETAEQRAKGSRNAYDLELLSNLWSLLQGSVMRGNLDAESSSLSARTDTLFRELERLCQQQEQPSTVLHARTLRLQIQLSLNLAAKEPVEPVLREFQDVVRSCEGLVGFPLEPFVEILMELGALLGGNAAYDELFDVVLKVQTSRKADLAAARMLLRRGVQQLNADQPYEAIRTLGLSLGRLYKYESREDAVRALYSCGCAYERVGLLWAARGTLLSAASLAVDEYWKYGKVTRSQAVCYRRLKWLELQLGRVPQALSWHQVDAVIRGVLVANAREKDEISASEVAFDAVLGILLLKTDHWELKWLSGLPDVLDSLGLFSSSAALMYALGYEDELRDTFWREAKADGDMDVFFLKWRDQPASKDLPNRPALYEGRSVTLGSYLLGCDIRVVSENRSPCVELAESLLAALESLLSTGTVERMAAREPVLTIAVRRSDFAKHPFEFELQDETGRPHINIICCAFNPHSMSREAQGEFKEELFELLATIFARIVMTNDLDQVLERLFRDELALDRSISFTGSFMTVANVLGHDPKSQISSWSDPKTREYPPKRAEAWDAYLIPVEKKADAKAAPLTIGELEPPPELRDRSSVKQKEMRTVSLIRETLWERAKWGATVFATAADGASPPILALAFKDGEAAKQILHSWRDELGDYDTEEQLRVAIVRGINNANPFWYRVLIGSNPVAGFSRDDIRFAAYVSRIHTMRPESHANLERFLSSYEKFRAYFLMAAVWKGEPFEPEIIYDDALLKRELFVRSAWAIGSNDPDCVAIQDDDTPIVPTDQENPPILQLLQRKQERRRS